MSLTAKMPDPQSATTAPSTFDAAVVIPTILRPQLAHAVRSVFAQDFTGTIQVLIGVDIAKGDRGMLDELRRETPERVHVSVIDLGYSTSMRNGGLYRNWSGGSLRTFMSYAANSRYVAYLDDDNWWAPSHVSDLVAAIDGKDWAWSYRWYVDPRTREPICVDEWESVGPGQGLLRDTAGGFVDTNCLMLDKMKCHWQLPAWCIPAARNGGGVDRIMFRQLIRRRKTGACTGNATAYYVVRRQQLEVIERLRAETSRRD